MRGQVGPLSTIRPAYVTATWPQSADTTPKSRVMNSTAAPRRSASPPISACACACTVTSSAAVDSSAMRTAGSLASAMEMQTRSRMPPDSSCGQASILRRAAGRRASSSRSAAFSRAATLLELTRAQGLRHLRADGLQWMKGREKALKHVGDAVAAQGAQAGRGGGEQILAVKRNPPCRDRAGGQGRQACQRQRRDRLAGAGLADQPQALAGVDRELDARERRQRAAADREIHPQALHGQPIPSRRAAARLGPAP